MTQEGSNSDIDAIVAAFLTDLEPTEAADSLRLFTDHRTGARYCECHVSGRKLVAKATTDVPLDPLTQSEYRANRNVVVDDATFAEMKTDALQRRSFSNLVTEYTHEFGDQPLKIIGGQHRFEAIKLALQSEIDEIHGIKVYFGLNMEQRHDVQRISNTNVEISSALVDRLNETYRGGHLRKWCQDVGFLKNSQDFGDKPSRAGPITVHLARTFVANYYLGKSVTTDKFSTTDTTPILYRIGKDDAVWGDFLKDHADVWKDEGLLGAGKEFAKLISAQRAAFQGLKGKADFAQKAMNAAVLSAWAYSAGYLQQNPVRLAKHYTLPEATRKNPLNAEALATGRHKTDPPSYRGLGQRTDARERGQMVELFCIQAEKGGGITKAMVASAIDDWFAKTANIAAQKTRAKIDVGN